MIFVKILRRIKAGVLFYFRALRLRKNLLPIDKKSPFKGKLSKYGFHQFKVSNKTVNTLLRTFKQKGEIFLGNKEKYAVREIFFYANKEVKKYLGKNACLDGINWMVTKKNKTHSKMKVANSINWHTDNVGARLKLFICLKGDKTQPTLIIPDENRIPSTKKWLYCILNESFRWWGLRNTGKLYNTIRCDHKRGSALMFDTQLLHRGSYESAKEERIIFLLEFSVPEKHIISRGPIGTQNGHNSFAFDKVLRKEKDFFSMLDNRRIVNKGNFLYMNNK